MKQNRIQSWDSHLLQQASSGDKIAFELLEEHYRPILTRIAMRLLQNIDDAHDVVQDTLLKAVAAGSHFDFERPVSPWICRICNNACVDLMRRRKRETATDDEVLDRNASKENYTDLIENRLEDAQVMKAVQQLPENYRQILEMRHIRNMEILDIAKILGKPEGTIKSWLFRARTHLKNQLEPIAH